MCIICFLEDATQNRMRKFAQVSNDRFENTLKTYKEDFIFRYKNSGKIDECDKHKTLPKDLKKWASNLEKSLPNKDKIGNYFDDIINVYIDWINQKSNVDKSIKRIFSKTDYQTKTSNLSQRLLFRARKTEKLESKEGLYHIPFHKRYLIGNQRYSISGIPSLYFGMSIPDIVSEMRGNYTDDLKQYCFAGYFLKPNETLNIFDFTNPFPSLFSSINAICNSGCSVKWNANGVVENRTYCIKAFYLFILYCCCSFNRRDRSEGNVFSEEYVLPQLITRFIYNKKFDGIAFESTRVDNDMVYSKESFYQNDHKLNYVLFTNYSPDQNYDMNLLNKFYISEPLKIDSIIETTDKELENVRKEIVEISNKKPAFSSLRALAQCTGISSKVSFDNVYIKSNDEEIKYWDSSMGKFHRYLEYCFLLSIRNEISKTI